MVPVISKNLLEGEMERNALNGTTQHNDEASLSPEQIKQLEATLTNFIIKKKPTGDLSGLSMMRPTRAGHGSHVQE